MDPNANLQEQALILAAVAIGTADRSDRARLRELREALHGWLAHGGFAPAWSALPEATSAYRAWVRNRRKFQDLYR
jgi:hypothetical protein